MGTPATSPPSLEEVREELFPLWPGDASQRDASLDAAPTEALRRSWLPAGCP
jgi:hypothetical protein